MLTFDDLRKMNMPGPGQVTSILDRLLEMGAATEHLLLDSLERLEEYGLPYVCCFAQLPFPLGLPGETLSIPGLASGVDVNLTLLRHTWCLDVYGRWSPKDNDQPSNRLVNIADLHTTQLIGYVRLIAGDIHYYNRYINAIRTGAGDQFINPYNHRLYEGEKRTPSIWDTKVATRVRKHFFSAIRLLLHAYKMTSRSYVPNLDVIPGYFVMLLPGCVSYGDPPQPLPVTLVPTQNSPRTVTADKINSVLALKIPHNSQYVDQLLAMVRLGQEGEPELALVGSVVAIESHLSQYVKWRDEKYRPSIRESIRKPPCSQLPEKLRQRLLLLADVRNDFVHGEPPERRLGDRRTRLEAIDEAVQIGFEVYRFSHQRRWQPLR